MLPMSNLMGGQLGRICLPIQRGLLMGERLIDSIPARTRALPLFCNKVIHRLIHRLCRGQGADWSGHIWSPPCVKFDGGSTYTPQKKIYAKVRSPGNVLFCTHIKVTLVTNRK